MRETWLAPNRRAIAFGCVPPLVLATIGGWIVLGSAGSAANWLRVLGGVLILLGAVLTAVLLWQVRRPRIAYEDGHVLFYLTGGRPVAVPVEIVEAFFLGQGPAGLPGVSEQQETVNLVARLSQRRTDWAQRDIKPALGRWCGGYVTIRGTWCEPLKSEVIWRLNRRLHEVKQNATSNFAAL